MLGKFFPYYIFNFFCTACVSLTGMLATLCSIIIVGRYLLCCKYFNVFWVHRLQLSSSPVLWPLLHIQASDRPPWDDPEWEASPRLGQDLWPRPREQLSSKVHFPAATASQWGFQVFFDLSPSSVLLHAKPRSQKRIYIDHQASSPKLASNSLSPNPSWGLHISDQIVGSQGVFLDPLTAHASWAVEPTGLPHSPAADWSLVSSPHDPDLGEAPVLVIQGWGAASRSVSRSASRRAALFPPCPLPPCPLPLAPLLKGAQLLTLQGFSSQVVHAVQKIPLALKWAASFQFIENV